MISVPRVGYARVTTTDRHPEGRTPTRSPPPAAPKSSPTRRPARLPVAPNSTRPWPTYGAGDTLVITKLDRLGRSVQNLKDITAQLREQGVGLLALQQGIDTTTAGGRLLFPHAGRHRRVRRRPLGVVKQACDGSPPHGPGAGEAAASQK